MKTRREKIRSPLYRLSRKERSHVPFHRHRKEGKGGGRCIFKSNPTHNQPQVLEMRCIYRVLLLNLPINKFIPRTLLDQSFSQTCYIPEIVRGSFEIKGKRANLARILRGF